MKRAWQFHADRLPDVMFSKSHRGVRATVVILGCILVACSSGDDSSDDFPLTEDEIQLEVDAAGESQRPFLEDGVITAAERERAFLNFVSCAADRGVEIYGYSLNPYGGDSFNARELDGNANEETAPGAPTGDERNGEEEGEAAEIQPESVVDAIVGECRGEHYVAINLLYTYQNRRTGEELEQFEADVAQCMRDKGAEVPDGATQQQMSEIDRHLNDLCWVENGG